MRVIENVKHVILHFDLTTDVSNIFDLLKNLLTSLLIRIKHIKLEFLVNQQKRFEKHMRVLLKFFIPENFKPVLLIHVYVFNIIGKNCYKVFILKIN